LPTQTNSRVAHKGVKVTSRAIQAGLRCGRVTKNIAYVRGEWRALAALRSLYELALPHGDLQLRIDDFDGDLKMDVDVREIIGINLWHRTKSFESHERILFCESVVPGAVVLDVGANIGLYTLLAAKRGARVFAIEADPINAELLRHHVHLNGFDDRVTIFNMAAVDRPGPIRLFRNHGNSGHSNIFSGIDPVEVEGNTIDSLNLPPIDVCKMDIEGAEFPALLGMNATIERSPKMTILMEYSQSVAQTNGLIDFIRARFTSVRAIQNLSFRSAGKLLDSDRPLPSYCNLWISK
jgi:FkbM family methyltransferase